MTRIFVWAALLMAIPFVSPLQALDPQERLSDPALEARAKEIGQGLRCLVCQNESIEDSNADLARDLRRIVRERVMAGDSDNTIFDYVVSRYGEFVLLTPPLRAGTLALWFGPSILLVGAFAWLMLRRGTQLSPQPLSEEESDTLNQLLENERR